MLTSVNKLLLLVSPFQKFFKNVLLRNSSKTFKKVNRFIIGERDNYLCQMLPWLVRLSDCIFYLLRLFNFCLLNFSIYVVLPYTMVK